MRDLIIQFGEIIGVLLSGVAIYYVTKIKGYIENKRILKVNRAINRNASIFERLVELRSITEADRVELFQFYNGEYYTTGESTVKVVMTYATVKPGVSFSQGVLYSVSGLPVSRITQILKPLLQKKHYSAKIQDLEESEWRGVSMINGTQEQLFLKVGKPDAIQGLIVCSWTHEELEFDQENIQKAVSIAAQIGVLFDQKT